MLGDGQLTGQFHGLGSGGSFAGCGDLVGGALDVHGGGDAFRLRSKSSMTGYDKHHKPCYHMSGQ